MRSKSQNGISIRNVCQFLFLENPSIKVDFGSTSLDTNKRLLFTFFAHVLAFCISNEGKNDKDTFEVGYKTKADII